MSNIVDGSLGGGSLSRSTVQSTFNIDLESDVISLLKLVHQNTIDPDVKNILRDLTFAYRSDQSETNRQMVVTAFKEQGVTVTSNALVTVPVTSRVTETPELQKKSLGIQRPKPRFSTEVSPLIPKVQSETASIVSPKPWPEAQENKAEALIATDPQLIPAEVVAPIASTPHNSAEITSRIKEIKSIVNEKVGNPVNLIDANNEVGREYMTALLDAMKKSNGGTPAETNDAMMRLEKAFLLVQEIILNKSEIKTVPIPKYVQEVSVRDEVSEAAAKERLRTEPQFVVPKIEKSGPTLSEKFLEEQQNVVRSAQVPTQSPVVDVVATTLQPQMPSVSDTIQKSVPAEVIVEATTLPSQPLTSFATAHSVAKEKQLQDLMRASRDKEITESTQLENARIATLDPLLTPEVNAGLNQLLSEWSLFKSSGIFGTGPSGKDHVLYKKLAPLTMAAVIAGRFEGATPKIKQSITDYMNGWRYEEGVVHDHGETFEHYLRKVIRNILEKQRLNKIPQQSA